MLIKWAQMDNFGSVALPSCPNAIIVGTVQPPEHKTSGKIGNVREHHLILLVINLHNRSSQRLAVLIGNYSKHYPRCSLCRHRLAKPNHDSS
jgi:hypothetical protein